MTQEQRIADLEAKLQQAEAAVAEMRAILIPMRQQLLTRTAERDKWDHAISTDCGQGWLSPEKVRVLTEALEHIARCHPAASHMRLQDAPELASKALSAAKQA